MTIFRLNQPDAYGAINTHMGGAGDGIAHRPQCADPGPAGESPIHRGLQSSLGTVALAIEACNRMVPTEERREGVLAFNEKRNSNF